MKTICFVSLATLTLISCKSEKQESSQERKQEVSSRNQEALAKSVNLQKAKLPKMVNTYIEWRDIRLEGNTIYNSYFVDDAKLNIPLKLALAELRNNGKSNVVSTYKKSKELKNILSNGFNFEYNYLDKEGKELHRFTIIQSDIEE